MSRVRLDVAPLDKDTPVSVGGGDFKSTGRHVEVWYEHPDTALINISMSGLVVDERFCDMLHAALTAAQREGKKYARIFVNHVSLEHVPRLCVPAGMTGIGEWKCVHHTEPIIYTMGQTSCELCGRPKP